jgi:hypothetical protein
MVHQQAKLAYLSFVKDSVEVEQNENKNSSGMGSLSLKRKKGLIS